MKYTNHFILFLLFILVTGCGPVPNGNQSLSFMPTPASTSTSTIQSHEEWIKERISYENEAENCDALVPVGSINISCSFPMHEYELLKADLELLRSVDFYGPNSKKLQEMLHLPDTTGESLFKWLEDHIHHILYTNFDSKKGNPSGNIALNYGSYRFSLARSFDVPFLNVNLPGFGKIVVSSPRAGLVRIGEGFFRHENNKTLSLSKYEYSRRYARLSTLFHEAVHTIGFPHVECPAKHPYDIGQRSCDKYSNGSYGTQILFLKSAIENCTFCNRFEKGLLRVNIRFAKEHLFPENELTIGHGEFE